MTNSQVTTYVFKDAKPSVITDARGNTLYYEYDNLNRLMYVKDRNNKILSKYEAVLSSTQFMRIHQSFLVNLEHILCYEKKDKNCVITTNNHEIPVSHRLKSKLIDYFEGLG